MDADKALTNVLDKKLSVKSLMIVAMLKNQEIAMLVAYIYARFNSEHQFGNLLTYLREVHRLGTIERHIITDVMKELLYLAAVQFVQEVESGTDEDERIDLRERGVLYANGFPHKMLDPNSEEARVGFVIDALYPEIHKVVFAA